MTELENKVKQLNSLVESENLDKTQITNLLKELKGKMLNTKFLTLEEKTLPENERVAYRTVLECDAIYSIKIHNIKNFALDIQKLKNCYFQEQTTLPKSEKMPLLLSIYLVYLLAQGKFVDFNIEIPIYRKTIGESKLLDYSTELLHAVVDNSFTKLFNLSANVPSPLFKNLTAMILSGARHSHADSLERSYKKLTLDELVQILHFENADQAKEFIEKRGWTLKNNNLISFTHTEEKEKAAENQAAKYVDLAVRLTSYQ